MCHFSLRFWFAFDFRKQIGDQLDRRRMIDSDDDEDFTESSIFDLNSAPPPPDGHHSPRSRRWQQPGGSLTNASPLRKRAFSAPSVSIVRTATMPTSRQVAFAASRDSEEPLAMHDSSSDETSSTPEDDADDQQLCLDDDDEEDEDDEDDQSSPTFGDEEQDDIGLGGPDDATSNSRTSAEIMEDELTSPHDAGRVDQSPTPCLGGHDISSSRWSDSDSQSMGDSGDNDTQSPTRSLPWGNELPDCCSADIISWNRTSSPVLYFYPMVLVNALIYYHRVQGSPWRSSTRRRVSPVSP
jgi:hypothetical protein